jgi:hypothetical protein
MSSKSEVPVHLNDLFDKSTKALSNTEQVKLKEFLIKYQEVFSKTPSDIGYTEIIKNQINTGDAKPIKLKPYRLPLAKREAAENEIKDMANRGNIEPSCSAWCVPILMITKKSDQKSRFCCDFRKLNEVTASDAQPLPRIDETLDALSGNHWLSTLDSRSGYW